MVFARHHLARVGAFGAAVMLLIWIIVQVAIIGYVSWMQPATLAAGLVVAVSGWLLPARAGGTSRRLMNDGHAHASSRASAKKAARFDFLAAMLTASATSLAFAAAILTPPKSGPFCTVNCVGYPYTDVAAHIPRDFLWMYPALLPAPFFVIMLSGLHEGATTHRRGFSRLALAFGAMAAAIITAVYFVQLRFVQPAVLKGELDGLAPWTQYNP